eukprot:CAMPEP_0119306156 /NCGR_PEP_ID=MMETSP1333-20130426/6976_1 /TAXON_ID=418940 /ORGANISM="Scyphosphaera apsteinii, Strain RCC1455" /LENGTH=301 /DNA_ID=CAMNT_0007309393 /DNA_START=201 /DNA_END=1106 /DNA_ORIENTATION=-
MGVRSCSTESNRSWLGGSSLLRVALEPLRAATNIALRNLGSPVRLTLCSSQNVISRHIPTPKTVAPANTLWRLITDAEIAAYVDSVLASDDVVNHPLIPDALERQIYMLVVRIVLRLLHTAFTTTDQHEVFGRMLSVTQERSEISKLKRSPIELEPTLIEAIAAETAKDSARPIISASMDHIMYTGVVRFALRLVSDMLYSTRITVLGVQIDLMVVLNPEAVCLTTAREHASWDAKRLERAFAPLVDELLQDEQINLTLLPDGVERQLYLNIVQLLFNIASVAAGQSRVDCFGLAAKSTLK